MLAAIETLLREAQIEAPEARRLAEYGEMLLEANQRTNLTGARTPEKLVSHLLDSLTLAPFIIGPLVDVGSGSGFPAIPLALVLGIEITMIEATGKRAAFLERAVKRLELQGEVIAERAETAARSERLRDAYPSATCRAVASGTATVELLLPFVRPSGLALLQRGRVEEAERAAIADAALVLGAELEGIVTLSDGKRSIVQLRKTMPTPSRFPRRVGVAERRPLCPERFT
ncbi:MAG: 16S rRNA (guanine(527)-N(7))-methyltransferase RsmG [Candidatus Tyrphobacter sp.]